ncbi:kinase-like domain-containing protein [Rhizophagus irregularis DAOM 181602=DAOM 197198]|nr:kinase-like domain-containing protein [Rhizophagus irregularis DAOM 181602=DAOM 197198]POG65463.1 kinase-like domain-containing protein [Rhizophagus irregularis DAOM 181602=DAOM 197198]|eukprot:XP_025172329.1 kinase-like domain-containing protein [Rhizophagus irregularis DAOM 181602=DAOM 197198]
MGLCRPANCESTKDNTYGVLPYMAPEILRGQNYNKAADIYSFGIIMYEVISGLSPFHDKSQDEALAIKICQGLRPSFNIKVPQLIMHTIKRCLDANPLTRPNAHELKSTIEKWNENNAELNEQIIEAEEINNNLPINTIISISLTSSHKMNTHSEAIYTSRLLNFNNLPEPKNSEDYYNQYENISADLQINIT